MVVPTRTEPGVCRDLRYPATPRQRDIAEEAGYSTSGWTGVSREQRLALFGISVGMLSLFSLWLSAAAVGPSLEEEWGLTSGQVGGLTMAVMVGFVVASAGLIASHLPDRLPTRAMFAVSALVALFANAALVLLDADQYRLALVLRFVTGVGLAGGYPSALKAVAGCSHDNLGQATGLLIGALSVWCRSSVLVRRYQPGLAGDPPNSVGNHRWRCADHGGAGPRRPVRSTVAGAVLMAPRSDRDHRPETTANQRRLFWS